MHYPIIHDLTFTFFRPYSRRSELLSFLKHDLKVKTVAFKIRSLFATLKKVTFNDPPSISLGGARCQLNQLTPAAAVQLWQLNRQLLRRWVIRSRH